MTEFLTNIETQDFVYKFLETFDLLYEFLYRAETNKLGEHIETDIISNNHFPGYENISIKSSVEKSPGDIYILIKFMIVNTQIGHVSFHLLKKNWITSDGPLHIGNDRSPRQFRRRRFRIQKRIETANIHRGLKFSLGGRAVSGMDVNVPLIEIANSVINVLNLYFDPTNPLSLTNKIDQTADRITNLEESAREILTNNFPRRRRGGSRRLLKIKQRSKNVTRRIRT